MKFDHQLNVGADLRVCPGSNGRTATGADTQVCPYVTENELTLDETLRRSGWLWDDYF